MKSKTKRLSLDGIMESGLAFWGSKTLLTAIEFGLFTMPAKKPMDGDAIRERLGLQPRSVLDFLDALVPLSVLEFWRRRIPLPVSWL